MGGQISAMEGLLMDAWTITGGSWGGGGARPGHGGGQLPPCPPLEPPMLTL